MSAKKPVVPKLPAGADEMMREVAREAVTREVRHVAKYICGEIGTHWGKAMVSLVAVELLKLAAEEDGN